MISSRREFLATSGASLTAAAMPGDKSIRTEGGAETGRWLYYIDGDSSGQPTGVSVFSVGGSGLRTAEVVDATYFNGVNSFVPSVWFESNAADEDVRTYFEGNLLGIGAGFSNPLDSVGKSFDPAFQQVTGLRGLCRDTGRMNHLAFLTTTMLYPEEWLSSVLTASACRRAGAYVIAWVVSPLQSEIADLDEYQRCFERLMASANICVVSSANEIDSIFNFEEHRIEPERGRADFLGGMVNRVVWNLRMKNVLGLHSPDPLGLPRWPELLKEKADRVAEQLLAGSSTLIS